MFCFACLIKLSFENKGVYRIPSLSNGIQRCSFHLIYNTLTNVIKTKILN